MNYKKTWFGWLNFTVGTLFMSVFIFTLLVSLFEFNGLTMSLFNLTWARASFFVAGAFIVFVIGLLVILRFFKKKISVSEDAFNKPFCKLIYFFGFILILGFGLYLRREALLSFNESSVLNQAYYVRILEYFDGNPDGTTDLFVLAFCYIYSFLLKVFGLSPLVLAIANYFFQVLGAIFMALIIKNLFGKTSSICAFASIMLLRTPIYLALMISPDCFIFAVIALVVFLFSQLLKDRDDGLMVSNSNVALFILFGLFFGVLIYINPVLILIPVVFAVRICLLDLNTKQMDIAINRKLLPTLSLIITSLITAVVSLVVQTMINKSTVEAAFNAYTKKIGLSGFFRFFYPDSLIVVCLAILFMCLAAYINYIFASKDNISAITVLFIAIYFIYAKNLIAFDTSYYLIVLFGAIMGIGVHSLFFEGYTIKETGVELTVSEEEIEAVNEETFEVVNEEATETDSVESTEEVNEEVTETENVAEPERITATVEAVESQKSEESETVLEKETDEIVESEINDEEEYLFLNSEFATSEVSTVDYIESTEISEQIEDILPEEIIPFVPIENVLPLPKPHVKKSIGYAFEPGEKYMKFDYEISDDDDFDID